VFDRSRLAYGRDGAAIPIAAMPHVSCAGVADILTLRKRAPGVSTDRVTDEEPQQSAIVYQACGMVSEQARCTIDDALRKMKERATDLGQTVEQIATAVVLRKTRFE
jgi:hypothetical protein